MDTRPFYLGRVGPGNEASYRWFVVHADEVLLSELDNKWNSVNLQTSWVLRHCSKPADTASPTKDSSTAGSHITSKTTTLTELAVDTNPSPPSSPPEPQSTQLYYPDSATPTSCTFFRSSDRGSGNSPPHPMNTNSHITLLHYNARSLFPKLNNLKVECEIHIICILTESWLDKDIADNELAISGFKLLCLDRNRHGGGVAVYIKHVFPHNVIF